MHTTTGEVALVVVFFDEVAAKVAASSLASSSASSRTRLTHPSPSSFHPPSPSASSSITSCASRGSEGAGRFFLRFSCFFPSCFLSRSLFFLLSSSLLRLFGGGFSGGFLGGSLLRSSLFSGSLRSSSQFSSSFPVQQQPSSLSGSFLGGILPARRAAAVGARETLESNDGALADAEVGVVRRRVSRRVCLRAGTTGGTSRGGGVRRSSPMASRSCGSVQSEATSTGMSSSFHRTTTVYVRAAGASSARRNRSSRPHVEDALAHQAVDGLANALVPVRRAHHGVVGAVPLEPRADLGRAPVLLHVGSGRVAVVRRNRTRSRVRPARICGGRPGRRRCPNRSPAPPRTTPEVRRAPPPRDDGGVPSIRAPRRRRRRPSANPPPPRRKAAPRGAPRQVAPRTTTATGNDSTEEKGDIASMLRWRGCELYEPWVRI